MEGQSESTVGRQHCEDLSFRGSSNLPGPLSDTDMEKCLSEGHQAGEDKDNAKQTAGTRRESDSVLYTDKGCDEGCLICGEVAEGDQSHDKGTTKPVCNHTICSQCRQDYILTDPDSKQSSSHPPCPLCTGENSKDKNS